VLRTHVAAQELVVEAALERRFDLALQALRLDPLSSRLNSAEARDLLRALDAHNARFGHGLLQ
jgi:alpha-galactosidase/6-phospho-beta-glucosidase family protein